MDYIDKLSDKDKEWLNDFMGEWNNAGVGKQSEAEQNRFHRTAKEVKDCTDRNNKRNSDIYGRAKAQNRVAKLDYETLKEFVEKQQKNSHVNQVEDMMIKLIDTKNENKD